jgi:hypothetical protein
MHVALRNYRILQDASVEPVEPSGEGRSWLPGQRSRKDTANGYESGLKLRGIKLLARSSQSIISVVHYPLANLHNEPMVAIV